MIEPGKPIPVVPLEDFKEVEAELTAALIETSPEQNREIIEACLREETPVPSISDIDEICLKLLMNKVIGTPAQRGSITRILKTLQECLTQPDRLFHRQFMEHCSEKGIQT